jgi:hypothetical protein
MRWFLGLMVGMTLLTGCTGARAVATDLLSVEGTVTVRGNEPFTDVILRTDGDNYYALDLTSEQRDALRTPSRVQATGTLYRGDFAGIPFARLRVDKLVVR